MTIERNDLDICDAVLRYVSGESEQALAKSLGVSRCILRKHLTAAGVQMRGRSEAMYMRMAHTTPEYRLKLSSAAHAAVRGKPRTNASLVALAQTREQKLLGNISVSEVKLADMLRAEGLDVTHQKAVGKYNVDIAAGPIAVEILGGGWHRTKRHGERLRYILDQGWDVIFIWIDHVNFPLGPEAAEYVISHAEFRQRYPSGTRCYRVIRGTGQFLAGGSADGDDIPDILPNSDRPDIAPAKIPFGFCHCGCGLKTTITPNSNSTRGERKGDPRRYISGHNRSRHPRPLN